MLEPHIERHLMKLYPVAGRYCRTQDDAKTRAKEVGVKFNPEIDFTDVPTKQAELADYLNRPVGRALPPTASVVRACANGC